MVVEHGSAGRYYIRCSLRQWRLLCSTGCTTSQMSAECAHEGIPLLDYFVIVGVRSDAPDDSSGSCTPAPRAVVLDSYPKAPDPGQPALPAGTVFCALERIVCCYMDSDCSHRR